MNNKIVKPKQARRFEQTLKEQRAQQFNEMAVLFLTGKRIQIDEQKTEQVMK